MSNETSTVNDDSHDDSEKVISSTISLWTLQDFDRTRHEEMIEEAIVTAIGIGLIILGGWLINILEGKEGLQCIRTIGFTMVTIGGWLGIGRWVFRLTHTSFKAQRRATGKYQVWNRVTKCTFCGQETNINVGYIEFDCLDCGKRNLVAYGIDYWMHHYL